MEVELVKKKKYNKKKIVSIVSLILLTLVVVIGGSNALFSYANKTDNQSVIAGDIYMKASGNKVVTASATPMSLEEGKEKGEKYNFSVQGYNDSKKDIYYGIYINYGEEQENKQRFNDEDIMIYLTETKEGVTKDVFGPGRLSDFNNNMIYASTIDANIKKEDKVTRDYELTVWLSDNILVSDTETEWEGKNIYTTEEYKNSYLSLGVKVEGDFVEKGVEDGKVEITAVTATSNTPYDLTTSPESDEDVKITLTSTKELEKIILINTSTGEKEELTPTENKIEKVISASGKYRYYGIFKDGKISATEEFTVNLLSDKTNTLNKPTNAICIERVYNGESQELAKGTKGYSLENNTGINATTYQVKVKLNEGYTWNDETTSDVTIECEIKPKDVELEWNVGKYTYTGEPVGPTATGLGVKDEVLTIETTKETDAGSHVSTATLTKVTNGQEEIKNYNLTNNTKDYEIEKAIPELTLEPVSGSVRVNQEVTFKATSNVEGTFKVTSSAASTATATLTPSTGKTTTVTVSGKEVGEADIEVQFESTNLNYSSNKKTYQVTVTEGIQEATPGSCKENLIYDGTSQNLINEGVGVTYNKTAGTNAGDYQITVTPKDGYEFENKESSKTLNCSIAKKDVAITAKPQTINYNETISKTTSDITADGLISGHSVSSISLTTTDTNVTTSGTITPSNATIKDSSSNEVTSNYNITYKAGNLTIKALTATMGTCYSRTYNGSSQTLIRSGTGVTYSSSSATVSSSGTSVTATSAGDYTITATAKTGYAFASGATTSRTCTISKRSLTITAKDQTISYGGSIGTGPSYITTGEDELVSGHSVYSVSLSKSTSSVTSSGTITPSNAVIKAGTTSSSTTVTNNYDITYVKGNLKITQASAGFRFSEYSGSVYVGNQITFTASANVSGTFSVRSTSTNKVDIKLSATSGTSITVTLTGVTVGSGYVYIDFTPTSSNYASDWWNYNVTVLDKSTPTLTLNPTSGSVNVGSDVTFTATTNVSGTFSVSTSASGTATATVPTGAGTTKTITVSGVAPGTAYIYVYFYPTSSSYSSTYKTYTVTVNNRTATKGSCYDITYDGSSHTLAYGGTGVTYTSNTATNAGSHTVTVNAQTGYEFSDGTTSQTLSCTINPKKITITASSQTITYGDSITNSISKITTDGLVSTHTVTAITLTPSTSSVTSSGTITPKDAVIKNGTTTTATEVTSNYDITYQTGKLTINQATPTLTLEPTSGSISVSESTTFKASSSVTGTFSATSSSSTTASVEVPSGATTTKTITVNGLKEGNATITVTFTPTNSNYKSVSKEYDVTVSNKTATLGSCISGLEYTGSSQTIVSGGEGVTYDKTTGTNAGDYKVTASLKSGYKFSDGTTTKTLNCSIAKKDVTITAKAQTINYNSSISKTTNDITTTGLISGHSVTSITLTPSTSSVTTTGTITPKDAVIKNGTTTSATEVTSNYDITYETGKLTINALQASMGTCNDLTYTGSEQTLITTGTGVTYDVSKGTDAKSYTITGTPKTGYAFASGVSNKVTCTINPKKLTITAKAQTINYNSSISKTISDITTDGLVSGHSVTSITLTPSTSSVTSSGTITPKDAVIKNGTTTTATEVTSNYDITYQTGKLTIKALEASEGSCKTNLTYTGSSQTLLNTGTGVTYNKTSGTDAGDYEITVTPETGYAFTDGSASKTLNCNIAKKTATIKASDQTIDYGSSITNSTSKITTTGLISSHSVTSITLTQSTSNATTNGTITPKDAVIKNGATTTATEVTSNYDITYQTGKLTINKVTPVLTLSSESGTLEINGNVNITASAKVGDVAVSGTYSATSSNSKIASVSVSGSTITVTGKGAGNTTITISFTPSSTTNYDTPDSKTYTVKVNYPATAKKIVDKTTSSNSVTDDDGIIYLSGTNNNINFNYVWYSGKLWRITSINPDGTMKLVTENSITSINWNSNSTYKGSWIYQWLNEDFKDTLYNYSNIIVTNFEWNASTPGARDEMLPKTNMVYADIGLLNSYEYYKAYEKSSYSDNYLNINQYWWTISNFSSQTSVTAIGDEGAINGYSLENYTLGVRPSIVLKSNVVITGSGTKANPYTISGDKTTGTANSLINTRNSGEYVKVDGKVYRIVGIENGTTKLISVDYVKSGTSVLSKYFSTSTTYGNGTSGNYWDYYLNNTWITTELRKYITEGTYYLGTVKNSSYKNSICSANNTTSTTKSCSKTNTKWKGLVGLPRVGEMFASQLGRNPSNNIWLITPYDDQNVANLFSTGFFLGVPQSSPSSVRPSIYLKSSVYITGGSGTESSPYTVDVPIATVGSCVSNLTYTGATQTIVSGGTNVTYNKTTGIDAGTYEVTATPKAGYSFADESSSKTLNCTIGKASPTLTLSSESGSTTVNGTTSITASAKVNGTAISGTYSATSNDSTKASVSVSGSTITVTGKGAGTTTITVSFTPSSTTNYNTPDSKTYTIKVNYPATAQKIVDKTTSSNSVTDDDGTIYLSGTDDDINFNYVWYSGKLWRITAINPDGTMKLITQGAITAITWGSSTTYSGSWIYQWLNEDFKDTLYNYSNIIVTNAKWNATLDGNSTPVRPPTDNSATMVTGDVGLLNAYEYAKAYQKASTSTNYLNIGYNWWLITPYSGSNVRRVADNGYLGYTSPSSNAPGVRPSINLKSTITLIGQGSKTNPYKISSDKTTGKTNDKINTRLSGEYVKVDNKIYRIVGIENNTTKLTSVDYVKSGTSVLTKYFSTSITYGNDTSDDYWDYYLNNTWLTTELRKYITDGTYYLGQYPSNVSYKNSICSTSNTTSTTKSCSKTSSTWTGLVGLPRVGEMFSAQLGSGSSSSSNIWLITPYSGSPVRYVNSDGNMYSNSPSSNAFGVRPSINLKSTVYITGGSGTESSPYTVGVQNLATETVKETIGIPNGVVGVNTSGQLAASGDTIREYRYSGAEVNNYVKFNNEMWRIIGIFKEGNVELTKLIRANQLTDFTIPTDYVINNINYSIRDTSSTTALKIFWNTQNGKEEKNDWATSGVMNYLNTEHDESNPSKPGYLSTLSTTAKNMINKTTFYLGNVKAVYESSTLKGIDDTSIAAYNHERNLTVCKESVKNNTYTQNCYVWYNNSPTWEGLIGLMYPSDYGYAASNTYWTSKLRIGTFDASKILNTDWLYINDLNEAFISPTTAHVESVAKLASGAVTYSYENVQRPFTVRPTLYLKHNVMIVNGDGTSTNPYQLSYSGTSSPNNQEGPVIVDDNVGTNKTASIGSCNNLVYNGEEQTLVSGGKNVTYSNNTAIDAGTYTVTANTNSGYFFSDGSTSKTLTCTIEKKTVTINYSNNEVKYTGGLVSPIATATGVKGESIELETTKESSIGDYTMITTMKNVNSNYTLRNTVYDYKIVDKDVKDNNDIKTTYKVNYYLMNKDLINYTLVKSNSYDAKVGESITGEVLEFSGYKSPKNITIEIIKGENIINYYYERLDFNK